MSTFQKDFLLATEYDISECTEMFALRFFRPPDKSEIFVGVTCNIPDFWASEEAVSVFRNVGNEALDEWFELLLTRYHKLKNS